MSSNFDQIPLTAELAALVGLKNISFPQIFSAIFILIFLTLADNQNWHDILSVWN